MLRTVEHAEIPGRIIGVEVGNDEIGSSLACFTLERVCCHKSSAATSRTLI